MVDSAAVCARLVEQPGGDCARRRLGYDRIDGWRGGSEPRQEGRTHCRLDRPSSGAGLRMMNAMTAARLQHVHMPLSGRRQHHPARSTCADASVLRCSPLGADMVGKSRNISADMLFTPVLLALTPPTICCVRAQSVRDSVTEISGGGVRVSVDPMGGIWLELRRLPPIMGFVGSGPGLVIILA